MFAYVYMRKYCISVSGKKTGKNWLFIAELIDNIQMLFCMINIEVKITTLF